MNLLYLTADKVGDASGGGLVSWHESQALSSMGECTVIGREQLGQQSDPWGWDQQARILVGNLPEVPKLTHIYSGTFPQTVEYLKLRGSRIVWTIAAHDREISKREHERLGIPFGYQHLIQEPLWQRYISGYLAADCIICPGSYPAEIVRGYPYKGRIEIIPHGCTIPEKIAPVPRSFVCGYLGSIGPDKGVRYLIEAWKLLNYKDARLLIAGRDSTSPFMRQMLATFGGGNVSLLGWQKDVADFYNQCSLVIQPSATEGFGLEVVEAMSMGRMVLCSKNAGAADIVNGFHRFDGCNVNELAGAIDYVKTKGYDHWKFNGEDNAEKAKKYEWKHIRSRYLDCWRSILSS